MRRAFVALFASLFAVNSRAADPRWIRIQSPNFEIYSTASEGSTRDTLKQFEQVRAFFLTSLPAKDTKPLPLRIVQFSSDKEYQPYRMNAVAVAYYKSGADRDMIVMSHGGVEHLPISIHEYVHLVMRHSGFTVPPWLNEGMAEVYSTMREYGGKIAVGAVIDGRLAELRRSKWVPLATILAVDQSSPYYNEKNKANLFYDESWALAHMLSLSQEYRPKWADFLKAVIAGKESADALATTYGKPLAAIERDLQLYTTRDSFRAALFDTKLEKIDEKYPAEPAPAFDVRLMLLDINTVNSKEQTRMELEKLAMDDPSRPEPYVQLGYLAWGAGKPADEEVRGDFEKAYSLGGRSPRMLWDYGRIIVRQKPAKAVQVLTQLSDLEPARRDVKIMLAGAMLNDDHAETAIQTLLELHGCTPDEAVNCMSIASSAYLRLNQQDKAQSSAELMLKYAKTAEDRRRAQQLVDALKNSAAIAARAIPAPVPIQQGIPDDESDKPPVLVHRAAPPANDANPTVPVKSLVPRFASVSTVRGNLVEFACGKDGNQFVLQTSSGTRRFSVDDPKKVIITGKDSETIDFTCGEQKPAPMVELGYAATPQGETDGVVRTLSFVP